jgi:hypothetical protein
MGAENAIKSQFYRQEGVWNPLYSDKSFMQVRNLTMCGPMLANKPYKLLP